MILTEARMREILAEQVAHTDVSGEATAAIKSGNDLGATRIWSEAALEAISLAVVEAAEECARIADGISDSVSREERKKSSYQEGYSDGSDEVAMAIRAKAKEE